MFKEKTDTKMLGEQGEGRQQEFEVKDFKKALPRRLHPTSMFRGCRGIQTYKYWSTGQVMSNTMTYLHKREYQNRQERLAFLLLSFQIQ